MHGVENHWIEYNENENAFGACSSTELLILALLMGTGSLWKYIVVNFFLSLGKRIVVKEHGNGFINPQKGKCVSITPPIKRSSGSRTL